MAQGASAPGAPAMRRPRGRRHRHLLHEEFCAHDDAGPVDAGAGAVQPSLPLKDPAGLEIAPEDIRAVRERLEREDLTVLAYRFEGDRFCRAERFAAYAAALGDRFLWRVLPDGAANTDVAPFFAAHVACPHSVVTAHLIDEAGQPTTAARDEILSFFIRRLLTEATQRRAT